MRTRLGCLACLPFDDFMSCQVSGLFIDFQRVVKLSVFIEKNLTKNIYPKYLHGIGNVPIFDTIKQRSNKAALKIQKLANHD